MAGGAGTATVRIRARNNKHTRPHGAPETGVLDGSWAHRREEWRKGDKTTGHTGHRRSFWVGGCSLKEPAPRCSDDRKDDPGTTSGCARRDLAGLRKPGTPYLEGLIRRGCLGQSLFPFLAVTLGATEGLQHPSTRACSAGALQALPGRGGQIGNGARGYGARGTGST